MLAPLIFVSSALAWGPTGHRAVGLIAERHVQPQTLVAIQALMGPESLARASTWPDEIRSDPAWGEREPHGWRQHFINAERGEDLPVETTGSDDPQHTNILSAFRRYRRVLADPTAPTEDRQVALRWIVHLVGDAHQPLHAGHGSDRGGNSVAVAWFDEKTNLHKVWDEHLLDHTKLSYTELVDFIDHPTRDQVEAWAPTRMPAWLTESRALLPTCYDIGEGRLSWSYAWKATPIMEERVLQAGVRLAAILDEDLGGQPKRRRRKRR